MKPTRLALLCLAAAVAAAPAVQANWGELLVDGMEYEGGAQAMGDLSMFFLADGTNGTALLPGASQAEGSQPWVDVRAATATAWVFDSRYVIGPGGNQLYVLEETDGTPPEPLDALDLHLTEFQPGFQVHIFTTQGTAKFVASGDEGAVTSVEQPAMGVGTWNDEASDPPADGDDVSENTNEFALVQPAGPLLSHQAAGDGFTVTITGDLVLEFYRITLAGSSAQGEREFATGLFNQPFAPGMDPATQAVGGFQDRRFVRLFLQDATLEIAAQGGHPVAHWAAPQAMMQNDGTVILNGATGAYALGNQGQTSQARGGQVVLPPGSRFALNPGPEKMGLQFSDGPTEPGSTAVDLASRQSATLVAVGAVLALAAAIGVGLLRRLTHPPALADVERSIEGGRFRRAARLAQRILRRTPGLEDAVLARGIALSKGGRNERAARELSAHLAAKGASDGSLHYVLGLAFLDIGRDEEGRAALREAVRLTPALADEVAPRLAQPSAPSPVPSKEANGYA